MAKAYIRQFTVQFAKDVKAPRGERQQTFFPTVGRAFEDEKRITVKLDSLPVGEWDGRLFLYEIKEH